MNDSNENHLIETPDLESSSASYAKRFSGSVGEYFLQVQKEAIERVMPRFSVVPAENKNADSRPRILDVGGGHAQLTPFLVKSGYEVTVLGSDENGRNQLDQHIGAEQYSYNQGSLLDLPYDDQSFDVVIAIRLLPHLVHWERFIGELSRVAKTAVIVDYPEKRSANYFAETLFSAKQAIEKDTRPYRCFSGKEIETAFEASNYSAGDIVKQFAVPMAIHRAIGRGRVSRIMEGIMTMLGIRQMFGSPVIRSYLRKQ